MVPSKGATKKGVDHDLTDGELKTLQAKLKGHSVTKEPEFGQFQGAKQTPSSFIDWSQPGTDWASFKVPEKKDMLDFDFS